MYVAYPLLAMLRLGHRCKIVGIVAVCMLRLAQRRIMPTWNPAHFGHVFHKGPTRLAHVCAEHGSHMGLMCVVPFVWWAFGGPELGTNWILCVLLYGSHMGCPHGNQLILATCFTKVPIGLAHVWAERGPLMGFTCVDPLFVLAFVGQELGTNWVLCGVLCGSHMGCPRGTSSCWPNVSQRSQLG